MIGELVGGRFRIKDELGEGGMGKVFLARDERLDRDVALKTMHQYLSGLAGAAERFTREAKALARLHHDNAVQVYDFGIDDGLLYIAMELLRGEPGDEMLRRDAPLKPERVVALALQICDVLQAAHSMGVVHRDMKPSNIFLDTQSGAERVKVVDFGLAFFEDTSEGRLTQQGQLCGTPAYMSPEQCAARAFDGRSDLYALGATLQELLSGDPPFGFGQSAELMAAHLYRPALPLRQKFPELNVPAALDDAILKSLAKLPQDRPATAADFAEMLSGALKSAGDVQLRGAGKRPPREAAAEAAAAPKKLKSAQPVGISAEPDGRGIGAEIATALGVLGLSVLHLSEGRDPATLGAILVAPRQGRDSVQFSAALAASPGAPPVLLCGPEDDADLMAKAIEVGVFDYVSLPLDPPDLARKVARALRRRR